MEKPIEGAVLFADVSGSTKLYDTVGDTLAFAAVQACVNLFMQATHKAGGRVIKTIGDEVMAIFPDADAAAVAAIDMQQGVKALPPTEGHRLGARIGFHAGPAIERDGDVFGDTVNLAARLSDVAVRGQVITSRASVERLNPVLRGACRQLHAIDLKGKGEVAICELLWEESEQTLTVLSPTVKLPASKVTSLVLKVPGREDVVLDAARPAIAFGRDKSQALVVDDTNASRAHGRIEWRAGRFFVVDHSVNGTWVTLEGSPEFVVRREDFALLGRGLIAFGQSRDKAAFTVAFECR